MIATNREFPHFNETLSYVRYRKKQDAISVLLDLEEDPAWASTLIKYGRWLENETLSITEEQTLEEVGDEEYRGVSSTI